MFESLITTLDKFTPEILVILSGLLVITTTLFLWLWFANRRTYNLLKHQLPASVVKTYLDSVIQNSNSLKSALFRGGGHEVGGLAIPSIPPLLGGGESMVATGSGDAALREQLQQKLAELAAMQSQLAAAQNIKKELETNLAGAQARIKELEALLAQANTGGGDTVIAQQLKSVSQERDTLKEKLKEYEIIEDDLANLKRLQQENQQLKRSLGAESMPVTARTLVEPATTAPQVDPLAQAADLFEEVPVAAVDEASEELAEFLSDVPEPAVDPEKVVETALNESKEKNAPNNDKTPEDLLSEFEKMLG